MLQARSTAAGKGKREQPGRQQLPGAAPLLGPLGIPRARLPWTVSRQAGFTGEKTELKLLS